LGCGPKNGSKMYFHKTSKARIQTLISIFAVIPPTFRVSSFFKKPSGTQERKNMLRMFNENTIFAACARRTGTKI
jgi:hypothetical protein